MAFHLTVFRFFLFGLGCLVATFWEKAVLSLNDMFSLFLLVAQMKDNY